MLVSELITRLQKAKDEVGDICVSVNTAYDGNGAIVIEIKKCRNTM